MKKQNEKPMKCCKVKRTLALILAAVMLLGILPNCRRILVLMNTTNEQFDFAYSYIFIIFCGVFTLKRDFRLDYGKDVIFLSILLC